jgi:hypothetical protein
MGMPIYPPCLANTLAGSEIGAGSMFPNSLMSTGTETGEGVLRDAAAHCFSPIEAECHRNQLRRLAWKSLLTPSQRVRKPKPKGRRRPRDYYDSASCLLTAVKNGGALLVFGLKLPTWLCVSASWRRGPPALRRGRCGLPREKRAARDLAAGPRSGSLRQGADRASP